MSTADARGEVVTLGVFLTGRSAARIRTWTIGTKSLRYTLLTMGPCTSLDMSVSTAVHGGCPCAGAIDVSRGCQPCPANRLPLGGQGAMPCGKRGMTTPWTTNCQRRGLMALNTLVRSLVAFVRFWFGFQGCGTSLLYRVLASEASGRRCPVGGESSTSPMLWSGVYGGRRMYP
jgi:hypothetical protein